MTAKLKFDPQLLLAVVLIAIILLLNSCATYERCAERYGTPYTDTVFVPYEKRIPVAVTTPADSVKLKLSLKALRDTTALNENGMSIALAVDNEELNIEAHIPPRIIRDTVFIRDAVPVPLGGVKFAKPPSVKERLLEGYKHVAAYGFLACLIIIYTLIKSLKNGKRNS